MKQITRLTFVLVLAACVASCERGTQGPHESEEQGIAVTSWGDRYEIFAEADPLVVGRVSKSHTHVTVLEGFQPLREGVVSAVLRGGGGPDEVFRQEKALRDGIFSVALEPAKPGVFELWFRVESAAGTEEIPSGRVRVGQADSLGLLVEAARYGPASAPLAEPPSGEPVSFLKEQQWRVDFATAWAAQGAVHRSARGPARIRPAAGGEALLTAPLDGVVAPTTRAYAGMAVGRGDAVVRLTPRIGSDRSQQQIRSELELAQARAQRLEELLRLEAASQAEVEEARARVKTLSADLAAMDGGGAEMDVRSPLAGRVAEVLVVPGQAVKAGDPLARVVRTTPLWVEVAMRPAEVDLLARGVAGLVVYPAGAEAPVRFGTSDVRLVSRAPEVDRATGSVGAILEVTVDSPLRPGAAVTAEVLLPETVQGVVVPATAVIDDGGVPIVYLQTEGETFLRQEVERATTQGGAVLVEGVPAGARLVTRGGAAIRRAALLSSGAPQGHVH